MKVNGSIIQCLQGERFTQLMSGFEFEQASQIVIVLYDPSGSSFKKAFVKVASESYPDAGLITLNGEGKMSFTIDTTGMEPGKYNLESRVDITGENAEILKQVSEFLTILPSRT